MDAITITTTTTKKKEAYYVFQSFISYTYLPNSLYYLCFKLTVVFSFLEYLKLLISLISSVGTKLMYQDKK